MAPYKNDCGQKNLTQTAQDKIAPYKNDSDQKNRNQTVENKKWHPIKMTMAKKNEPQCKIKKYNL